MNADPRYLLVTRLTALLVWGAGALKSYAAAASPPGSVDYGPTAALAGAEILFGCWLFTGLYAHVTRRAAVVCFLGLLGV